MNSGTNPRCNQMVARTIRRALPSRSNTGFWIGSQLLAIGCVLLLIVLAGTLSATQINNGSEMLSSYQFSGPLYGLMRKYDAAIRLSDLDESYQTFDGDPIDRLLAISKSHGVQLTLRSFDTKDPQRIPTPSLIVIKESDGGRQMQSFLLAEGHTKEGLLVYEFRKNLKWNYIPYSVLESQFTGSVIYKPAFFGLLNTSVFCSGLLIMTCSLIYVYRSRK